MLSKETSQNKLTEEIVESLRLEVEDVSPTERKGLLELVQKYNEAILEQYAGYIQEAQQAQDQTKKFLFIQDRETFNRFVKEYSLGQTHTDKLLIHGATFKGDYLGDYIVLSIYNALNLPVSNRFRELVGANLMQMSFELNVKTIIHELFHIYCGAENQLFSEAGAVYYTSQILESMGLHNIVLENDDKHTAAFQKLIDNYGEDVHKLFFGQKIHSVKSKVIYDDLADLLKG